MKIDVPSSSEIRKRILEMAFFGQSVHIPSAFSIVEIIRVLHDKHLNYPANNPRHPLRDFLVLSKGHGVMALYPILESRGWIPGSALDSYFSDASLLPGLCEAVIPGCEANTGSLGQGLPVAVGLAMSSQILESAQKVFCVIGDGEVNEGSVWEALMYAGHHRLSNLTVIVDQNRFQAMGQTSEILTVRNLETALASFGFRVKLIDGHSERALDDALTSSIDNSAARPLAIIANTTKGKGVEFMEDINSWHYKRLDRDTFDRALLQVGQPN
jgi:transketolase